MAEELTDEEIIQRIAMCDRWMRRFRDADIAASRRFRDVNNSAGTATDWEYDESGFDPEGGDVPMWQPVSQPNWLTTNIVTKVAAIAMGNPALHVKANEDPEKGGVPNAGQIVAAKWKQDFKDGSWKRVTQTALLKRSVCGMGFVAGYWDSMCGGPCFEHVPSWQIMPEPYPVNWQRLFYGGRKIKMTLRQAMAKYDPDGLKGYFTSEPSVTDEHGINKDAQAISIKLYWDRDEEVHTHNGKVLRRDKNHYGRVPLLILEGDIDPTDNAFSIGDNVLAGGLQQGVTDLTDIAVNSANHGGPINLIDEGLLDIGGKEALLKAKQQGFVPVKSINKNRMPIERIPGEQLSPAWSIARTEMQNALDAITGVTPPDRGQQIPNITATQSVLVQKRAGARPTQARAEYEEWMTKIAEFYVLMMQKFGGPTETDPGTDEQQELWRAFMAVTEVEVVESSTTYSDPSMDQQQAMQALQTASQVIELFLTLAQMGLTDEVPNLKQLYNDMLRAFSRQNIESYWIKVPKQEEPQKPDEALVKAMAGLYKDSPPDIRRQIEQDFGLQPSQTGDTVEDDGSNDRAAEIAGKHADHTHDAIQSALQRQHEMRMEKMKQDHASRVKLAELSHEARMVAIKPPPNKNGGG